MDYFKIIAIILWFIISIPAVGQTNIDLESPDGNIAFSFQLNEQVPIYQISYKGKPLINESDLGLKFKTGAFKAKLRALDFQVDEVDDKYELLVGKAKTVRDYHRELRIPLVESDGNKRKIILEVRAFNDGIAFCYEFPKQEIWSSYSLIDEQTMFNIAGDPTVKTLFFESYTNSHEGFYNTLPYEKVPPDTLLDIPALFEFAGKTYMAITEANLRDYAGMYLKKTERRAPQPAFPFARKDGH